MVVLEENKRVLAVGAHPGDVEFMCAGTLALLYGQGWKVYIATLTAGDCGSREIPPDVLSERRQEEAITSAKILQGGYACLGESDFLIVYCRATLKTLTTLVRKINPLLVFTHPCQDYMPDHENTALLVQTVCLTAPAPNFRASAPTGPLPATSKIPHLYHWDPLGLNYQGQPVWPGMVVDIRVTLAVKREMLDCHETQRSRLLVQHGIDEYVGEMERWARERGQLAGCSSAGEGFTQHLGHPFPQNNLLKETLDNLVWVAKKPDLPPGPLYF